MKDALEYTNIYTHTCVLKKKYIHTHKYLYIYNRKKKNKNFRKWQWMYYQGSCNQLKVMDFKWRLSNCNPKNFIKIKGNKKTGRSSWPDSLWSRVFETYM